MAYKRYLLALGAMLLLTFGGPVSTNAARSTPSDGIRIIELSAAGQDIANSVAYSPDGKFLAVGTSSGVLILDTLKLSKERVIITGHWARSIVFSPDGQMIAAGLFDGTARFWQLADGKEVRAFTGHKGWIRSIAFSHDGQLFATAGDDNTVRMWDVNSGLLKLDITGLAGVRVLALSPDSQSLAVGLDDATIQLLNVSDGSLVKVLKGHTGWVRSLTFSPDGKTLASGAFDATAILWDVTSGQMKYSLTDHQSSVLALSFALDGKTLASGSVDGTVKLWNVENGTLLRTLVGHNDFVYSVAFSPDGREIASGSSDNSVRLWNLTDPSVGALPQSDTPGDCRACHHPRGSRLPPRVIQVSCEMCHADGIGLNWCPFFPRSTQATGKASYFPSTGPLGLPVSSGTIAVRISYPTNGETLYATSDNLAPVFVKGFVSYHGDVEDTDLRMEIRSGDQLTGELRAQPDQDGAFLFKVVINPEGTPVVAGAKAADPDCATCHEDFVSQTFLPNGQVHIVVTAVSRNGDQAVDERWITVDTSIKTDVDVRVVDQESGASIPGLEVRAATLLYDWRERYATQVTGVDGIATLSLETLSQATTGYEISIPSTWLNGFLYESAESLKLDLVPRATCHEPLTIYVNARTGRITGKLTGAEGTYPLEIWAVHLPDGEYQKISAITDEFVFDKLSGGEYLVFVDPSLEQAGYYAAPVQADLRKEDQASINVELTKTAGPSLSGHVHDEDSSVLPFGWITVASQSTVQLNPVEGTYRLSGLDPAKITLTVDAPGYYSQTQVIDLSAGQNSNHDFLLVLRPETRTLHWGDGRILLPSESLYEAERGHVVLEQGWVWGMSEIEESMDLQVAGTHIALTRGSFALEYLSPGAGWFYLLEGEATIRAADGQRFPISGGQMVALSNRHIFLPVSYEEVTVAALHIGTESPLKSQWEPSLGVKILDRLNRVSVSIAQVVTFVTYVLVLIVIVALLIGGIYSTWKNLSKRSD